jgi:hypothetical protein
MHDGVQTREVFAQTKNHSRDTSEAQNNQAKSAPSRCNRTLVSK